MTCTLPPSCAVRFARQVVLELLERRKTLPVDVAVVRRCCDRRSTPQRSASAWPGQVVQNRVRLALPERVRDRVVRIHAARVADVDDGVARAAPDRFGRPDSVALPSGRDPHRLERCRRSACRERRSRPACRPTCCQQAQPVRRRHRRGGRAGRCSGRAACRRQMPLLSYWLEVDQVHVVVLVAAVVVREVVRELHGEDEFRAGSGCTRCSRSSPCDPDRPARATHHRSAIDRLERVRAGADDGLRVGERGV